MIRYKIIITIIIIIIIIDFAVPYDTYVDSQETGKIEKYQNLAKELKKLGTLPRNLKKC